MRPRGSATVPGILPCWTSFHTTSSWSVQARMGCVYMYYSVECRSWFWRSLVESEAGTSFDRSRRAKRRFFVRPSTPIRPRQPLSPRGVDGVVVSRGLGDRGDLTWRDITHGTEARRVSSPLAPVEHRVGAATGSEWRSVGAGRKVKSLREKAGWGGILLLQVCSVREKR